MLMKSKILEIADSVIDIEINGLVSMKKNISLDLEVAVQSILSSTGRTIICGMGKSGIIGKKIAASFASTGTPSFFMHPGEAFHGDLGMVKPEDTFIAISNSGETEEVLKLLPFLKDNGNYIIAMTGNPDSTLTKNADCNLDISVPKEACSLQLAPTASTTATLVMGDILTVALMESREFKPENFARFHPGGSLGRRLLGKVKDEMVSQSLPFVDKSASFSEIVHSISSGQLGLTLVGKSADLSIITDGDLRRTIEKYGASSFDLQACDIAHAKPLTVEYNSRVHEAYECMELNKVSSLVVYNAGEVVGILKK